MELRHSPFLKPIANSRCLKIAHNLKASLQSKLPPISSQSASVYKGIDWLERHFTLDKEMWGTDQGASSDPQDMSELVGTIRMLEKTLGVREGVLDCEKDNMRKMR